MRRLLSTLLLLCAFSANAQFMSAHRLALDKASFVASGMQVDTFLDFHSQTLGQVYNTNLIQSDVWGNTSLWSVTSEGTIAPHTFTNVTIPNFTFTTPIQTPDGHIATGTGTLGVRQDLAEGANGTMILQYSGFSAHIASVDFWFMCTNISSPSFSSYDLYQLFSNPYAISQFHFQNSLIQSGIHTSDATPSQFASLPPNLWIHGKMVWDNSGLSLVKFRDASNESLIFSSVDFTSPTTNLQQLLKFEAGYIYASGDSGFVHRSPMYLQTDANVLTNNTPPWMPNAPTSVTGIQIADNGVRVAWVDNNDQSNPVLIDASTNGGSTWTTSFVSTGTNTPAMAQTNIAMTGLSNGATYIFRTYSVFPPNGLVTPKVQTSPITIDTPILFQDYEGTGTPPSFSVVGGSPNFHNTSSPLTGAKDLLMGGGSDDDVAIDIGSLSEVWMITQFLTPANPVGGQGIIYIEPSGHQVVVQVQTDGTLIIQQDAATVGSATSAAIPINTKIWIKFHAKKGTGADAIYDIEWSTDGSFVGSGSKFTSYSSGTLTGNFTTAELYCASLQWPGTLLHFDNTAFYNTAP